MQLSNCGAKSKFLSGPPWVTDGQGERTVCTCDGLGGCKAHPIGSREACMQIEERMEKRAGKALPGPFPSARKSQPGVEAEPAAGQGQGGKEGRNPGEQGPAVTLLHVKVSHPGFLELTLLPHLPLKHLPFFCPTTEAASSMRFGVYIIVLV